VEIKVEQHGFLSLLHLSSVNEKWKKIADSDLQARQLTVSILTY
jgi:hypothetical protein